MELLNYETSGIDERILRAVKEMGFDNFYGFTDILAELEQKAELSLRISFMSQPVGKKMDLAYGKEMKNTSCDYKHMEYRMHISFLLTKSIQNCSYGIQNPTTYKIHSSFK